MEERSSKVFKVFIGSPGDVSDLRKAAFDIIKRLSADDWRPKGLVVERYGWDVTHYPKLANVPPQINIEEGLPDMRDYDLCLFILGARLGTPLDDADFQSLPDGRQPTGTEYEYHSAVSLGGRPAVLVYYCQMPPKIELGASVEDQRDAFEQFQLAQAFVNGLSKNEAGRYIGDLFAFQERDAFVDRLTQDLKRLINDRLPTTGEDLGQASSTAEPVNVPEAYLAWLKNELPDLSLKGLKPKASYPVRLPDIYVPALVAARQAPGDEQELRARSEHGNLELLLSCLDRESRYVSGAPGAGKTTFCLWLCWLLSEGRMIEHPIAPSEGFLEELPRDLTGRLPLLCRLRDFWGHMDCARDNGNWTRHQLEQGLVRWLDAKGPDGLTGQGLRQWLNQGRCLLIFDGFDEVPERQQTGTDLSYPRAALLSGLAQALSHWQAQGNRILLTSRPYGLSSDERRRLGLEETPLQPLPGELQQLFIRRWYATTHGGEGAAIADELWRHLQARDEPWLDDLAHNPLLLTALCVKFSEGQVLPTDQHELFDAVVENTLYSRYRDAAVEILPVRRRLETVAWGMQSGEVLNLEASGPVAEIRLDQVDDLLSHYAGLNPLSEAGSSDAAQKRAELLNRSGLLLPYGSDQASFYHLMFQDFFAAEYALRNDAVSTAVLLKKHAGEPRWHSLFVFLLSGMNRRGSGFDGPLATFGDVLRPQLTSEALARDALPAILWGRCLELAHAQVSDLGVLGREFGDACSLALSAVEDPEQRSRLFDSLARLGLDQRSGVGLNPDGPPDIHWVEIPGGEFVYGEGGEKQKLHLETFSISRYPITNCQYQAFVDDRGYEDSRWWHALKQMAPISPHWKENTRPRETLSWYEAVAYCRWLTDRLGYTVSLPTEQQWEKAARGSKGRLYPWGNDFESGRANADETWGSQGTNNLGKTTVVGLYPKGATPQGIFDLSGNVWEWCSNKYDDLAAVEPDESNDTRVLRGGSWLFDPDLLRSSNRICNYPDDRSDGFGFRLVCRPPSAVDH